MNSSVLVVSVVSPLADIVSVSPEIGTPSLVQSMDTCGLAPMAVQTRVSWSPSLMMTGVPGEVGLPLTVMVTLDT